MVKLGAGRIWATVSLKLGRNGAVTTQEVGRNAEKPGPSVSPRWVKAATAVEGGKEGLGGELIRQVAPYTALQVGVHGLDVAVEDCAEVGGVVSEAEIASLSAAEWSTD